MTMIPVPTGAPTFIGPYEVCRPLGAGGMGEVFLARSPGSRLVALKVVRAEYAEDRDFRLRFRREVDAARRVSGLFTPPVLDADPDGPRPWLATAYVPAPSLSEVVRGFGVLTEPALRALGAGLAEALGTIHAAGLVHRDLKPGNVLLAADGPRVIDFGISKAIDATQLTHTGGTLGTPGYLAPEQIASGRDTGPAADVFAFACVLVFAATGLNPFGAGTPSDLYYRIVYAEPNLAGTPDGLRPLLAECLAKPPQHRPSVADLLDALTPADPAALLTPALRHDLDQRSQLAAAILRQPPAQPVLTQPLAPPKPSRRRFLGIAAGVGVVAVAGSAGAVALLSGSGQSTGTAESTPPASAASTVPAAPAASWSRTAPKAFANSRLALLGDTLAWYGGGTALGFDAHTGNPLWTKSAPYTGGEGGWLGAADGVLYGAGTDDASNSNALFGIDATGKQVFTATLAAATTTNTGYYSSRLVTAFFGASNGIALWGASKASAAYTVIAVDLATGTVRWTHPVSNSAFTAVADGQRCYIQDNTDTLAVDLTTGATVWQVANTAQSGLYPVLALASGALLLTSVKLLALDPATGKQLWTAINESTTLVGPAVVANRVYVGDGQNVVYAVDSGTGKTVWQRQLPVDLAPVGPDTTGAPLSCSASVLLMPLLDPTSGMLAVRASDGAPLWARPDNGNTSQWAVLTSTDTVYGASGTTLYAFPGGAA